MTQILKIMRFFLLVSIATLFIKIPSFHIYYRISDLFLLASFVFMIIAIVKKEITLQEDKKLTFSIFFLLGVNVFGTILSLLIYKTLPLQMVILNYARLASCVVIFSEIILISQKDKSFIKKSIWCLMGSLTIIPLIFIFEELGYIQYLMFDSIRFSGLLIDPNYFANFQIIPTILLLFFLMKDNIKIIHKIVLYILFVLSISTIIWSGSRSGILGLLVSVSILSILFIKYSNINKNKMAIVLLFLIISFPLGLLVIPKNTQEQSQNLSATSKSTSNIILKKRIESFVKPSDLMSGQDRLNIWNNSIYFILRNPFGYGPGYNQIINLHGDGGEHRVVHNFELEMLLQGGVLLFIFFNYLFIKLLIKIYKSNCFNNFNEIHALVAIIIGILTSALFLDSIPEKWIWVILALVIAHGGEQPNPQLK